MDLISESTSDILKLYQMIRKDYDAVNECLAK